MSQRNDTNTPDGQQGGGSQQQAAGQQGSGGQQQAGGGGQAGGQANGTQGGNARQGQGGSGRQGAGRGAGLADWFASRALRTGIILVGFTLFLFALGQAVGLELLGMFVDAVTSQTGRWLVVAAFALVLIFVGQQGVKHTSFSD